MKAGEWNYEVFWKEAINQIQEQISEQEFLMWFRNMEYLASNDSQIIAAVPSTFYKDQVTQRYLRKIEAKLFELSGHKIALAFKIQQRQAAEPSQRSAEPASIPDKSAAAPKGGESAEKQREKASASTRKSRRPHAQLNTEYNFERFVRGENNDFAYMAAYAIARNPGKAYNPCMIYGGVGLGKTHLLQAIGNSAYQEFDDIKVVYVTAETFTNEFILSIKENTSHRFKNKYRSVDMLLIDDVHFLPGKVETQEELFHTFNALYDANKQMVFTSDRPVSELKKLSDRLRSRFERGLNVDLQPPNFETRIAILKKKIEEKQVVLPDEVVELICQNIKTNVRDLEKALTKLIAYAELVNKTVTLEIAERQLKDFFTGYDQKNVTMDLVQRVVAEYFGLSLNDLKGKKRSKAIAFPRQLAMYIARDLTEFSTTEVGLEFGGRDHTTVMHACQRIEDRIKTDPTLAPAIQHLTRSIKEYRSAS
jgi:chromosomal replication initiator protein